MAEAIGTAVARVRTEGAAPSAPSTDSWATVDLEALANLPERLDDQQLAMVEHVAGLPVPGIPPAPDSHFLRCLRTLTILPTRADDDMTGELRVALYRKHFGSYSVEALSFLTEHATAECKFFPTPAECFRILERWHRGDTPYRVHQLCELRVRQEWQARFDDMARLIKDGEATQEQVDALPERWKRILAAQGLVRIVTYALRPVRGADQ